jgi:hypothetical protein
MNAMIKAVNEVSEREGTGLWVREKADMTERFRKW